MSFFDSKEEVINIELTDYGKKLFSLGTFQPKYYAFFDEDIIYDLNYAGIGEKPEEIEKRILENSIFLKPLSKFTGSHIDNKYIGTVLSNNQYLPSWKLDVLEGTTIENIKYDVNFPNIPQINLNSPNINVIVEKDNIDIKIDNIIIELEENNTISGRKNFEISLFQVDNNTLIEIPFSEQINNIKNGILYDYDATINIPENDSNNAEYYFDLITDTKINQNRINDLKNKIKNIYL